MIAPARLFVFLAALASSLNLSAQGRGPLPETGDLIPAVSGFAEDGSGFPLETLKGHFSVIAFGCLT